MNFENYIKNKNVIFVGPASNIQGKTYGKLIDSYDIVIRSNGGFPVLESYMIDYGSSCDILYINNLFRKCEFNHRISFYNNSNLKFICHKGSTLSCVNLNSNIKTRKLTSFKYNNKKMRPYLGLYIINELIRYNAKNITLTGIDFYESKYIDNYLPDRIYTVGKVPLKWKNLEWEKAKIIIKNLHNKKNEFEIMKEIIKKNNIHILK
jgi:hypothetical protein